MENKLLASLKEYFAFDGFKPGQVEIIREVMSGNDTLGVLPTGGGKSLCYQLPSLLLDGTALVISPLISLMKDQVDALESTPVSATYINSTLTREETEERFSALLDKQYNLLYIAPERFRNRRFNEIISKIKISFFAIDEAHCISEWGHDFRPDYLRLKHAIKELGRLPCLALTATATPEVREDIIKQLEMNNPRPIITGFDRPNLFYRTEYVNRPNLKKKIILDTVKSNPGSGIVYTATRKDADSISEYLNSHQIPAVTYHAGLPDDRREKSQADFMESRKRIIVATNAFGMGIDKRDIRTIIHNQMPGSPESYYQEAGRAGRDGDKSTCLLLYHPSDKRIQDFFINESYPSPEILRSIYNLIYQLNENPVLKTYQELKMMIPVDVSERGISSALHLLEKAGVIVMLKRSQHLMFIRFIRENILQTRGLTNLQRELVEILSRMFSIKLYEGVEINHSHLSHRTGYDRTKITRILKTLDKEGIIEYIPPFSGRGFRIISDAADFDKLEIDWGALDKRKSLDEKRLEQVIDYATTKKCLRGWILDYFGDINRTDTCSNCHNCTGAEKMVNKSSTVSHDTMMVMLKTARRLKGSFGKIRLAQIVTGSKSAYIKRMRLHHFPYYDTVNKTQDEVVLNIEGLITDGYLKQTHGMYPTIEITSKGLKTLETPEIILAAKTEEPVTEKTPAKMNSRLFKELRDLKNRIAERKRLPGYCVIGNRALEEMAASLPLTMDELLEIKGVGKRIAGKYGKQFLGIIQNFTSTTPVPIPALVTSTHKPQKKIKVSQGSPVTGKTYELYRKGHTIYEISSMRGLDESVIFSHLAKEISLKKTVNIDELVSREHKELIVKEIKTTGDISEIKSRLPDEISYGEIELISRWFEEKREILR